MVFGHLCIRARLIVPLPLIDAHWGPDDGVGGARCWCGGGVGESVPVFKHPTGVRSPGDENTFHVR